MNSSWGKWHSRSAIEPATTCGKVGIPKPRCRRGRGRQRPAASARRVACSSRCFGSRREGVLLPSENSNDRSGRPRGLRVSVREFYDALAPWYELVYPDWEASIARQADALAALMVQEWGSECRQLLDAAVGVGTQALGLAARGYSVTGADLSPVAVRRARTEAGRRALSIPCVVADMRAIPVRDRSVGRGHRLRQCRSASIVGRRHPARTVGVPQMPARWRRMHRFAPRLWHAPGTRNRRDQGLWGANLARALLPLAAGLALAWTNLRCHVRTFGRRSFTGDSRDHSQSDLLRSVTRSRRRVHAGSRPQTRAARRCILLSACSDRLAVGAGHDSVARGPPCEGPGKLPLRALALCGTRPAARMHDQANDYIQVSSAVGP